MSVFSNSEISNFNARHMQISACRLCEQNLPVYLALGDRWLVTVVCCWCVRLCCRGRRVEQSLPLCVQLLQRQSLRVLAGSRWHHHDQSHQAHRTQVSVYCSSLETHRTQVSLYCSSLQTHRTQLSLYCSSLQTHRTQVSLYCISLQTHRTQVSSYCSSLQTHRTKVSWYCL